MRWPGTRKRDELDQSAQQLDKSLEQGAQAQEKVRKSVDSERASMERTVELAEQALRILKEGKCLK